MIHIFQNIKIIDWYDDIIKAICQDGVRNYYCSLLALDEKTDEKIYVLIDIEYFIEKQNILNLMREDFLGADWTYLRNLFNNVNPANESWLIKTENLNKNQSNIVKYKTNFDWKSGVLFGDYPEVLSQAIKIDNWWGYW